MGYFLKGSEEKRFQTKPSLFHGKSLLFPLFLSWNNWFNATLYWVMLLSPGLLIKSLFPRLHLLFFFFLSNSYNQFLLICWLIIIIINQGISKGFHLLTFGWNGFLAKRFQRFHQSLAIYSSLKTYLRYFLLQEVFLDWISYLCLHFSYFVV